MRCWIAWRAGREAAEEAAAPYRWETRVRNLLRWRRRVGLWRSGQECQAPLAASTRLAVDVETVGCGVRPVVASAGGEGWGARVVRGGVSGAACRGCRVWELNCLRSRTGLWVSVACGGGGCVLLPVSYYEEVMRVKTAWGLRPESLGRGNGALAAGYPRVVWPGSPGAPWGQRLPTSAGCETTACISVTEVLRF